MSKHSGKEENKNFEDYFQVEIIKSYKKPFTRCVEEGTLIASHEGEILNPKSEWHQAKVIRTTTRVVQGGAEVGREQGGGGEQGAGGEQGGGQQDGGVQGPREHGGRAGRARGR